MKKINTLGKPCPLPVIEAKKAIRELKGTGGKIEILVDNEIAQQNIEKMTKKLNLSCEHQVLSEDEIELTITIPKDWSADEKADKDFVVLIGKKTLGDGDESLGEALLKSYIYSLTELDTPPEHLLFYNSGAYLTSEDSSVLKDLRALEEKGTQISTCGMCLDFYNLTSKLAVGTITNMYGITETMTQAKKVITL